MPRRAVWVLATVIRRVISDWPGDDPRVVRLSLSWWGRLHAVSYKPRPTFSWTVSTFLSSPFHHANMSSKAPRAESSRQIFHWEPPAVPNAKRGNHFYHTWLSKEDVFIMGADTVKHHILGDFIETTFGPLGSSLLQGLATLVLGAEQYSEFRQSSLRTELTLSLQPTGI